MKVSYCMIQFLTDSQDVGADSTIQNKEGMTAVDVAPISVLHVFKEDVAKVPPLEEQQQEQQQQTSAGEEPPATRQIKLKLREEQAEYIGDKARKATNTDRGAISTTQNSNSSSSSSANNSNGLSNGLSKGNASESEPSFSFIKRALSPKPSPRPDAEESAPEGPKQIPESMDIEPAAPCVISEEKANKSFKGKVPEKPAPILEKLLGVSLEKPGASALPPPPKQQPPRPSGSGGGASLSRAATILEMSKAAKSSKAQSPAVVAAGVQATASADSAEQSTTSARKVCIRLRFHRLCLFLSFHSSLHSGS